jgi:hypothetical protein
MQHFLEVGLAGKVPWPLRRSSSTPLDFLFWGFLKKNCLYMIKIRNMAHGEVGLLETIEQIWYSLH